MIVPNHTAPTPTQQAAEWNRLYPPGTPVRFWSGVRAGAGQCATTRDDAYVLVGHTAVIMLEGVAGGCIALSHVEAAAENEPGGAT